MPASTYRRLQMLGRVLAVLAAGLWIVVLVSTSASATARGSGGGTTTTSTTPASSSCPADSTCATIPAHCPQGTTCPEVVITPTTDLGTDQAVFVSMENFKKGHEIYIYYCSNKKPLSATQPVTGPECMLQGTPGIPYPNVDLIASPAGTASITYTLSPDTDDGNLPLDAKVPGTQITGSFFCDDASNPCSIDVSDPLIGTHGKANTTLTPTNTAVVPLSYNTGDTGCGRGSPISTTSEFGIESLIGTAAQVDCVGKSPVVGINTAIDSLTAAESVAALTNPEGFGSPLGFVDEPNAPDVQEALEPLKGHYVFIPVALSANVLGYKAIMGSERLEGRYIPDNSYELTPTMVAGLITDYYSSVGDADIANCGPAWGGQCSLLAAVNAQTGFRTPGVFAAYVRSDASYSTAEVFDWICSAPEVPVYLGTYKTQDENVASKVLLTGINAGLAIGSTPLTSCPSRDVFPSLTRAGYWSAVNTPVKQAGDVDGLSGFVPPPNVTSPNGAVAAFAPMSWTEADYNGLLPAALQNPAGQFVLPSAPSLDAAVAGATVNANGTLTPNFDNSNPAAYPLPDVWYAIVPTGKLGQVNGLEVRTLLDNVLSISGGSQTADLPPGFAPLTPAMYKQAVAEVDKDVVGPPPTPTTTVPSTTAPPTTTVPTTTVPTTTVPTTTVATTTVPQGTVTATSPPVTTVTVRAKTPPTTTPTVPSTTPTKVTPAQPAFQTTAFDVLGRSDSWLIPAFVSVVAVLLLLGPALWWRSRRRAGREA